jgi:hypothetical protein
MSNAPQLVQKLWNYCDILRADGLSYGDFVEQAGIVAEVERRLSMVDELSALVTSNLQCTTRLRQSILQRAFEGNLLETKHATR